MSDDSTGIIHMDHVSCARGMGDGTGNWSEEKRIKTVQEFFATQKA